MQNAKQIFWRGKNAGIPIRMHRSVIPCGNILSRHVIRRRDIGVRPVEDRQALRLFLQIAPVRIGLGDVPADDQLIASLAKHNGGMSGEWPLRAIGHDNHKRIRPHERQGVTVLANAKMFRNVHE